MISIPGRIPIYIFPFFWLLILMIGWLNSGSIVGTLLWAFVVFFSVLVHEYGHALTALAFGQEAEINLVGLGGLTKRHGPPLSRLKEFVIVLNGPLAGFLLFLLILYLDPLVDHEHQPLLSEFMRIAGNVNFFWTIINLLPILPLDGGHLFRILLEGLFGLRGLKFAFLFSMILAGLFGLYFFLRQELLIGALFFMIAFEGYRAWDEVKRMAVEDSDEALQGRVQEGIKALQEGNLDAALSAFTHVRHQAPKGLLYVTATQYGAHILAKKGNYKQAYEWLFPLKSRLSMDYVRLLQQLAYRVQEWEEAIKIGQQAYQQEPNADVALINAFSYAIMGEATPAVGWLRSVVQMGFPQISEIITKREFDAIRDTPVFQAWLKTQK